MERPLYEELDSVQLELWRLEKERAAKMEKADITFLVIDTPDEKFGYAIFIDGELYLEQKTVPAIDGSTGFESKEEAEKVAALVITKIKSGKVPPSVTPDELKAIGIAFWPNQFLIFKFLNSFI